MRWWEGGTSRRALTTGPFSQRCSRAPPSSPSFTWRPSKTATTSIRLSWTSRRRTKGATGRRGSPKNYDGTYSGPITLRDAIAYSKNAATVRLLEEVGIGPVKKVLRDLGIDEEVGDDLSIALGTSNLTLLDLVKGFSAFANGGMRVSRS